jgi:ABC-2 type transport system permease protein
MLVAILARTPATVMTLSWFVLTPLTFVSNAYVDPATMPHWLQSIVAVNPVTHLISALRNTMAGNLSPGEIVTALLGPALVTLVCAPTTLMLYRRR